MLARVPLHPTTIRVPLASPPPSLFVLLSLPLLLPHNIP
jgi:hypothetical protein